MNSQNKTESPPIQTIMRLLQVLVPQVEKICIDKGLTDESEILRRVLANKYLNLELNVICPQVPSARDSGGTAARPAPHTYQEVPAQPRDGHVVSHIHVGGHIPEEHRSSYLVSQSFGLDYSNTL